MHSLRGGLLLTLLLWGSPALPAHAAQTGEGWISSSSPSLDFRTNGSALPMYGVFAVCLAVFLVGVYRRFRDLGFEVGGGEAGPAPRSRLRGFARLFEFGLLQRRLRRRRYSAWTHLLLFWGFVVLALGSLAIMLEIYGLQPLGFPLPRGLSYKAFHSALDACGLALLGGVALALNRRLRIRPEHTRANGAMLIALFVLFGMGLSGFVLEGLRIRLEGVSEPWSFAGNAVAGLITMAAPSQASGLLLYKILWWSHAVTAFGLIAAVPYSPLRHVLTSPLHILVAPEALSGKLATPFRLAELMQSGRFDVKVGVQAAQDFSWRERLALHACAEFGGCQDVCPAYATGTPLSPMRFMEDLEQKLENGSQNVLGGDASEDAIWSCTLCGACTQSCPVLVDPMGLVVQLRRGLVSGNRLGKQRTELLSRLSYAGNPYGSNGTAREGLAAELGVPTVAEQPQVDLLYWVGCAATFDARARAIADATIRILQAAGVRAGVLGPEERCCGDPARRVGEEGLFQELVSKNIAMFEARGIKKVVTHCAHCFNSLRNEYAEFGARIVVEHHSTLIHSLIDTGRIQPRETATGRATLHDSCYIGRFHGSLAEPRDVLRSIPGVALTEMERSREKTFCCGAGGGNYWYDVPRHEKMSASRIREAEDTGACMLVTECPFCLKMLEDAAGSSGDGARMQVRDIAEVVAESLGKTTQDD